jgi:hypothetical protein
VRALIEVATHAARPHDRWRGSWGPATRWRWKLSSRKTAPGTAPRGGADGRDCGSGGGGRDGEAAAVVSVGVAAGCDEVRHMNLVGGSVSVAHFAVLT